MKEGSRPRLHLHHEGTPVNFDILLFLAHSSPTRRIVWSYWQIQEQALRHGQLSLCLCRTHYVLGFPHAKACWQRLCASRRSLQCHLWLGGYLSNPEIQDGSPRRHSKAMFFSIIKKQATTKHPKNCYFLLQLLIPLYCLVSKHMEEKRSIICPFSQTQHPVPNTWAPNFPTEVSSFPDPRCTFYTLRHADMPGNACILRKHGWSGISVLCVLTKLNILGITSHQT